MKKQSFMIAFMTALPAMAIGAIFLLGSVVAEATIPNSINLGGMKVNEQKTFTLFVMNTSATQDINITTACSGNVIEGSMQLPVGSTQAQPISWNKNGLTVLPANISAGNVLMTTRTLGQGTLNCTLSVNGGDNLNITWVNSI